MTIASSTRGDDGIPSRCRATRTLSRRLAASRRRLPVGPATRPARAAATGWTERTECS